jgi:hypothetical protein
MSYHNQRKTVSNTSWESITTSIIFNAFVSWQISKLPMKWHTDSKSMWHLDSLQTLVISVLGYWNNLLLQLCKIPKKNNQKRIFHKLMWEANYGCYATILLEPCNLPQLNNFIVHLSMHHRTKWSGECVRYHLGNETLADFIYNSIWPICQKNCFNVFLLKN